MGTLNNAKKNWNAAIKGTAKIRDAAKMVLEGIIAGQFTWHCLKIHVEEFVDRIRDDIHEQPPGERSAYRNEIDPLLRAAKVPPHEIKQVFAKAPDELGVAA